MFLPGPKAVLIILCSNMYQPTKDIYSAVSLTTHLLYIPTTCITGYVCSLVHRSGDAMHPVVRDLAMVRLLIIMTVLSDPSTTNF